MWTFSELLSLAEETAKQYDGQLIYDCVSLCARQEILAHILGEQFNWEEHEQIVDDYQEFKKFIHERGWQIKEIFPIGCPRHVGEGEAYILIPPEKTIGE